MTPAIILQELRRRSRMFQYEIAHGPGFTMLVTLAHEAQAGVPVSVTSLCLASYTPPTTALRHLGLLEQMGLVERNADPLDARRVWIELTETGAGLMAEYFGTTTERSRARD